MKKVSIIMDFVCPYCFVAEELMWKVLKENHKDFQIEFLPYELVPEPEELKRVTPEKKEYFLNKIIPWAEKEKIEVNFPTIDPVPRTSMAFEGLYIAKKYGLQCEYIKMVMEAYWINNRDIGKIETLLEIAKELGMNQEKFKVALETGKYKERHREKNSEISQWDFEVVPTFYVNEEQIKEFPRNLEDMKKIFV